MIPFRQLAPLLKALGKFKTVYLVESLPDLPLPTATAGGYHLMVLPGGSILLLTKE